jgi:hypothetical protein
MIAGIKSYRENDGLNKNKVVHRTRGERNNNDYE